MSFDLAAGHAARIHRDDLIVEAIEAGLPLLDQARLELRRTVAGYGNLKLPALAANRFPGLTVTGVAGVRPGGIVLFVAEMMGHLTLQRTLDYGFGELLQQPVEAFHIVGRLVVFQKFV
jgi:hypothetical protein